MLLHLSRIGTLPIIFLRRPLLGGIASGFLVYVISKITDDLSKAELINPVIAAWLPTIACGLAGFVALLFQEDG